MERLKVAIVDVLGLAYDDQTVETFGLGGSESAVIYMARELQKIGFDVTVYNTCQDSRATPGVYFGVTYKDLSSLPVENRERCDILVVSRSVRPFLEPKFASLRSTARHRVLWLHDTFCDGDQMVESMVVNGTIDEIFTLSDFHTSYVLNCDHGRKRNFEVLKRHTFQTRNGIRRWIEEVDVTKKDRNLFVYNASATKGMIPLVEHIWPRVKARIPEARLKVIGGYYRFRDGAQPDAQEQKVQELASRPENASLGIEFTGVIPQSRVAEILASAGFTIYPGAFPETFGISTVESLAYNTPVITTRFGALEETAISDACYLIDYAIEPNSLFPMIDKANQIARFVQEVCDARANTYLYNQKVQACNALREFEGWNTVALQWKQHFFRKLGLYFPVQEFRKVRWINSEVAENFGRRFRNIEENETPYVGQENHIQIITPFYNAENYIQDCILSVAQQDYQNYTHILIDDCSTDKSFGVAEKTIESLHPLLRKKFRLYNNTVNKGAVRNQVETIRNISSWDWDPIIMLLDGDDSLANDNTLFQYYNWLYQVKGVDVTYGSMWSMADNIPLIAQPYPAHIREFRTYRKYRFAWNMPYTHLRTFRSKLFSGIEDAAFKDIQGYWYRAGGDCALFYEVIERADPDRIYAVTRYTYNYNDLNPLNDYKVNGKEQAHNANEILARKKQ